MKEEKELTKRNKQIIGLNCALALFSVIMAYFAYVSAGGPPWILVVIWLSGMLLYSGINYLEQQMRLTPKLIAVRNASVLLVIISGLGFMAS